MQVIHHLATQCKLMKFGLSKVFLGTGTGTSLLVQVCTEMPFCNLHHSHLHLLANLIGHPLQVCLAFGQGFTG